MFELSIITSATDNKLGENGFRLVYRVMK